MAEKQLKAVISSTILDLPEHRKEVMDACLSQRIFPVMMEYLPASDSEAISISLEMVDEADLYLGVFGHRYGYVPKDRNPDRIGVTEMEYNRAVERKIPRFIFVMDEGHPITIRDVEKGSGEIKLADFLERVKKENVVKFFKSPVDLRAHVINSVSQKREPNRKKFEIPENPTPPEKYVAHPYILQQTPFLVGRHEELQLLTDWIVNPESDIYKARVVSIVAIGGMGKSALTWKWFNEIAPQGINPFAGQVWWSFYEADGSLENFVARSLAYVSGRSFDEVLQIPIPDRESRLLDALNKHSFAIVLDGFERLLVAYARGDAARLTESEVEARANLRRTAHSHTGKFLKKLVQLKNSRILISTRLLPAELETVSGTDLPGCYSKNLAGLIDNDAIELWRAFGISGSRQLLLPIFASFEKHPLLIQALAGEISGSHKASGNFDKWRELNPRFDPTRFALLQDSMGHVLETALRGLDEKTSRVLHVIAAFRITARYDTLAAILNGKGKLFRSDSEFENALRDLENRGLIGWDKYVSRFDLHPIVRSVVWSGLGYDAKQGVYTDLRGHFEALPTIDNDEIKNFDDLTPTFELYNTLIGLERYDEAWFIFSGRLRAITYNRFCVSLRRVELLEMLFPDGLDSYPRLSYQSARAGALHELALSYDEIGSPGEAIHFFHRFNEIHLAAKNDKQLSQGLSELSGALADTGRLLAAETAARRALVIARRLEDALLESLPLQSLGIVLGQEGFVVESQSSLMRALGILEEKWEPMGVISINCSLSSMALCSGNCVAAQLYANLAWELANVLKYEPYLIGAAISQGEAGVKAGPDFYATADERLHFALSGARAGNWVREELAALIALAELRVWKEDRKAARELLDDVWEYAKWAPYPLLHADALNVLAQIEQDGGNTKDAIEAATKAYELAWCDGPPYAYHWGLIKAQKHLEELGAPLPDMPPFDESKYEPMPEVEIDPDDEFHVGKDSENR